MPYHSLVSNEADISQQNIMKVIKLSTTRQASIWVTSEQLEKLNKASITLRSAVGDPYCQAQAATTGEPTYSDAEIEKIIEDRS